MMGQQIIWKAKPHTIAKINLLKRYLFLWFSILGRAKYAGYNNLIYVDGFAGPGEYTNYQEGSPIAAITAANDAIRKAGTNWSKDIHCIFIEANRARCAHLEGLLQRVQTHERIKYAVYNDEFSVVINSVLPQLRGSPSFIFLDPFGVRGVPFDVVNDLLNLRKTELLINLDVDGIGRVARCAKKASSNNRVADTMNVLFGTKDWEKCLESSSDFKGQCIRIRDLYVQQLGKLAKYVFSLQMRDHNNTLNYFLVFVSKHHLGMEKMKEIMQKVATDRTHYIYSTAHLRQNFLFGTETDPSIIKLNAMNLFEKYRESAVSYDSVRDFILNETPYVTPQKVLKYLSSKKLIEVIPKPGHKIRANTFPAKHIDKIKFLSKQQ